MAQDSSKKCFYYNSGYCKYSKKENGCKDFHPTESCTQINCKNQGCPLRHPKKCKFLEKCSFQKRCCYKHEKEPTNEDVIIAEEKEVNNLKAEIETLKQENNEKVNILAKVHLQELKDLRKDNTNLLDKISKMSEELIVAKQELVYIKTEMKEKVNWLENKLESKEKELEECLKSKLELEHNCQRLETESLKKTKELDVHMDLVKSLLKNEASQVLKDINRVQLSDKPPAENGPKSSCNMCKESNTTSLQFFKRMSNEFSTSKQKDVDGVEFIKCKHCGKIFRESVRLVKHAIMEHQGQEILETKFKVKTCILKHTSY